MKKALWLLAVVLSIVFLLLGLAGIAGVWVGRSYAQGFVNDVFNAADEARAESSARVAEVIAHRQELQAGLDELSAEIDNAARQLTDAPVVFMAIDRLLDGKVEPALKQLDQAGRQVYADLAGLNAAVKTLNNISLFSNRQDALDQIGAVLDRLLGDLERLDSDFQALAVTLRERKAETIQTVIAPSQTLIAQLDAEVGESQVRWQELESALDQLQLELDATRANLLRLLTLLAIVLTAVLLWLVISQVLAARYAWGHFHGGPAPRVPADEPAGQLPPGKAVTTGEEDSPQHAASSIPVQDSDQETGVVL
jgi:hypothetical protein